MHIQDLTPAQVSANKPTILRFMKRYGDGRITHRALRWFKQLGAESFPEGTHIAAALEQKKLIGVIVIGQYGLQEAFIAVHPDFRQQKVGEGLVQHTLGKLDKLYTRVACDNTASLKLCFSCGLVAFNLFKGPTGKPTLWLGGGNFQPQDIENSPLLD
ncbi:GNAT family N-acetyltransferase [Laceyella putida]|uniref:GNAT family N-acetyltransferase n=1 Tax=Laceyella putida TaxID=110101 RepID=A0ABW2RPF2_9BACL